MKSILFSRFDINQDSNSSFISDFQESMKVSEEGLIKIVDHLPKILSCSTDFQKKNGLLEIEQEIGIDIIKIDVCINVLYFFVKQMQNEDLEKDSFQLWAEDIKEISGITTEQEKKFENVLTVIKNKYLDSIERESAINRSKNGVLPCFKSISTTVELRAVLENEYQWKDPVENFSPKIIELIPIISVSLHTDSHTEDHYYFQIPVDDLDLVIKELLSAKKIAETMKH
jgi:hypothetical protein